MSFNDLSLDSSDNVIRSAVNIANDDFDYYKYAQAFAPNDYWNKKSKTLPPQLPPGISVKMPHDMRYENQPLKSCPTVHQSRFTFDDLYCGNNESNSKRQYGNLMTRNKAAQEPIEMLSTPKSTVDTSNSILKLQITGNPNYELDESDILSIFSPFGNILRIDLAKHRMAFIVYDQIMDAVTAQKKLHSQQIKHLNIKLYLSWTNHIDQDLLLTDSDELSIEAGLPTISSHSSASKSLPNLDLIQPNFSYNLAKFTCKYEVQIEGDRDFKIARKIIGPKGCNMKKIIEICQAHLKHLNNGPQGDFLKLRLRGQGSGFKEGPEQRESDDVLHLCVSSKYSEVYYLACKLVESLMTGLYKEYEQFCQKAGRPLQEPVQLKRVEIYGNNEAKAEANLNAVQQDSTDSFDSNNAVKKNSMKALVLKSSKYSTTESSNASSNSDREVSNSPPRRISGVLQTISP